MGTAKKPEPALPVLSIFSRYPQALEWARCEAQANWGAIALKSPVLPFENTRYYEKEMGSGLKMLLLAYEKLIDPGELIARKLLTNRMESEFKSGFECAETRPLNLDPGYLTPLKLVLASTKDASHRLYLGQGIYGEVTLHYAHGCWRAREWTYANYLHKDCIRFLQDCRKLLLKMRKKKASGLAL